MKPAAQGLDFQKLAFVALGSNLGDSWQIIKAAFDNLQQLADAPLLKSSLWETTPVDCPPGSPKFLNAVTGIAPRAGETPASLLAKLQVTEKQFGRQTKKVLNEARPLDLDIIAFANERCATETLILPHPRAHLRRFVLQPLCEIAPGLILPGQTETVSQLLAKLPPDPGMRKSELHS